MKKKYQVLSILAVAAILVSIISISAVSVGAEQQGSIKLEYNYTDPTADKGNTDGTMQGTNTPNGTNNAKTGDATASIAGGLTVAALLSASIACFAFKRKKKAG